MILEILGVVMIVSAAGAIIEDVVADRRRNRWKKVKKTTELQRDLEREKYLKEQYEPYRIKYYDAHARIGELKEINHELVIQLNTNESLIEKQEKLISQLKKQEYKGKKLEEIFQENEKLKIINECCLKNLEKQIGICKQRIAFSEGSEYTRMLIELEAFNRLKSHIDGQTPKE